MCGYGALTLKAHASCVITLPTGRHQHGAARSLVPCAGHAHMPSRTVTHARGSKSQGGSTPNDAAGATSSGGSGDAVPASGTKQHNWTQQRSFRRQARTLLLDKQSSSRVSTAASKAQGPNASATRKSTVSNSSSISSAAVSAAPVLLTGKPTTGKMGRGIVGGVASARALVLDSAYRPINVVHWKRAVEWDVDHKAEVLDYYEPPYCALSGRGVHMLPAVLRLSTRNINLHKLKTKVTCTRRNVMVRDKFTCQYCGAKRDLTLDHLLPVSKGGRDEWTNLVTACATCNQKKGNNLLQNMKHMQLRAEPKEPTLWELGVVVGLGKGDLTVAPAQWEPWIAHYKARFEQIRQEMREAGLTEDEEEEEEQEGEEGEEADMAGEGVEGDAEAHELEQQVEDVLVQTAHA